MADRFISQARKAGRWLVLCGAGLGVASCTVGPEYETPTIDLPDRYSILMPVPAPASDTNAWWRQFKDPVLNQLVDHALEGNINLREAEYRILEAQAASRRDGVRLEGSYSASVTEVFSSNSDSIELDAGLTLGLFGGQKRRGEAALARLAAAEADADNAGRLLMSELSLAYVQLRLSQAQVMLREQDLRSRRRTLRDIRTQKERGEATRLDELRAQALAAETEATLPQLTALTARQRNRITTLLGQPAGTLNIDLSYPGAQPAPQAQTQLGVPADLLRRRGDIRQAERLYAAAISEVGAAEADRYPSLSLNGNITAPLDPGSSTRSLTAGIVIPLLQQRQLEGQAGVAAAQANQAYLQWRLAVITATEEVENALASIAASGQAVKAARKVVRYNEEALSLSRTLLESGGEITVLDLLDRERSVSAARTQLAQALHDYAADYVTLNIALGFGVPVRGGAVLASQ